MHRIFFAAAGFYLVALCLLIGAAAAQTPSGTPPGMAGAARLPPGEGRDATIRTAIIATAAAMTDTTVAITTATMTAKSSLHRAFSLLPQSGRL
jgi:hypothetical protein